MQGFKKIMMRSMYAVVVALLLFVLIDNYSFIFSKKVIGEVIEIERVTQPAAVLANGVVSSDIMYSFSLVMRDQRTGKYVAASTVDRQFAAVKKGHCAEVRFYPYPPWNFEKSGTFFNARLIEYLDCQKTSESKN